MEVNPEINVNLVLTLNNFLSLNVEPNPPPMNTDEKDGFRATNVFAKQIFWQIYSYFVNSG